MWSPSYSSGKLWGVKSLSLNINFGFGVVEVLGCKKPLKEEPVWGERLLGWLKSLQSCWGKVNEVLGLVYFLKDRISYLVYRMVRKGFIKIVLEFTSSSSRVEVIGVED